MPHFTIEAQGGTIPLTAQSVYNTLLQASGGTLQGVKVATEQLSNWEKHPGYYSLLQDVYADFSLDQTIRFQAIIQLKNGIDKHWRKTSVNPIGKDEKIRIRSHAIQVGIAEPAPSLSLHTALMVAKIVRYEFPHDWPDVISTLIDYLRQSAESDADPQFVTNVLTLTLQIIKELASGKLSRTRKSLQQISLELLHVLGHLYINLVSRWTLAAPSLDATHIQMAHNSYTAMKILRRLLVAGFEHPHREKDVEQFWQLLQQHQNSFWTIWQNLQGSSDSVGAIVTKHLLQQSKLYLEMARNHAASFVLLSSSMDILSRSWSTISLLGNAFETENSHANTDKWQPMAIGDSQEETSPLEKLALKALLLFRACLKMVFNPAQTFKYQHPQDKEDRKLAVELIKAKVLTDDTVVSIMEILVTKYFVLRLSDLRDWESEPDEWERREDEIADAWEYAVRSCSEKLFLDLIINFKELLVPKLLQVFHRYASVSNTDVFIKESLYSAVGIAAACLEDTLDFNEFLCNTLLAEVHINQPHYNLLRRRAAILLGQWVPIKPDSLDRRTIYQIFTHLLSTEDVLNDFVVRVTAGRQLRHVLEPFEFNYEDFSQFATPLLQSMMLLISETELTETKMSLLETVRVAVTKLEGRIEPYADDIMSMLPTLWADSGEEHLMKQAVLTMITAIITSLGPKSKKYHADIIPLIYDSVKPDSEASVYLLEEALDLWAAIIQQAATDIVSENNAPSLQLLSLCGSLIPLLDMTDTARQTLELLESYVLLSPSTILAPDILLPMLTCMKSMLDTARSSRSRDISGATQVLEHLISILSTPNQLITETIREAGLTHLIGSMVKTGYLSEVLALLTEAYDYHKDPRPSKRPPDVIGPAETSLFCVLARIALANPVLFVEAIHSGSSSPNIEWLMTEWITHFDSIGDILRRKLQALAITNLLKAASPPPVFVLEQLQSLMTMWTDVLTELGFEAPEQSEGDYLWHATGIVENPGWSEDIPEDSRKRVVNQIDPTYSVNMRKFLAERLHSTIEELGEDSFRSEWLSRLDNSVLKAFVDLKIL
jgi:Importin-beta N-terminal domain